MSDGEKKNLKKMSSEFFFYEMVVFIENEYKSKSERKKEIVFYSRYIYIRKRQMYF